MCLGVGLHVCLSAGMHALCVGLHVCLSAEIRVCVLTESVEGLCAEMMMSTARNRFANQFSRSSLRESVLTNQSSRISFAKLFRCQSGSLQRTSFAVDF